MSNSGAGTHASLDELVTEARNPDGSDLDLRSTRELVELMSAEDSSVPAAVAQASAAIAARSTPSRRGSSAGGRLIYVGAGTSGRLAALDDASAVDLLHVSGLRWWRSRRRAAQLTDRQEAAEDDAEAGARRGAGSHVAPVDAVVGVSASGRTPYVLGGIDAARAVGALTVAVVSVDGSQIGRSAEHEIAVVVGPEIVSQGRPGSRPDRAEARAQHALDDRDDPARERRFGNLMVDVYATNEKLHARVRRVVREADRRSDAASRRR